MSTKSQNTPEYGIFRAHYASLVHAIQDPLPLAIHLFSKGIIPSALKENMSMLGLSRLDKNNTLLSAVEFQIQANPSTLHAFLSALNEDPSMQSLVECMKSKCLTVSKSLNLKRQYDYTDLHSSTTCKQGLIWFS